MGVRHQQFPPLLVTAYIALIAAGIALTSAFACPVVRHISTGLLLLSTGFTLFGIGEILNHPKEALLPVGQADLETTKFHHRRNSCGLGNLCDIVSLLFFFMALSSLFFPR